MSWSTSRTIFSRYRSNPRNLSEQDLETLLALAVPFYKLFRLLDRRDGVVGRLGLHNWN